MEKVNLGIESKNLRNILVAPPHFKWKGDIIVIIFDLKDNQASPSKKKKQCNVNLLTFCKFCKLLWGLVNSKPNLWSSLVKLQLVRYGGTRSLRLRITTRSTRRWGKRLLRFFDNSVKLMSAISVGRLWTFGRHFQTFQSPIYENAPHKIESYPNFVPDHFSLIRVNKPNT